MAISAIDESQRNAAKVAGIAYLLSFGIVVSAFYGIYTRLVIPGNTAETARNIIAHERLFRILIAGDVLYGVGTVAVLTALYVILRPVNRGLAVLAAFGRLVWALMYLVIPLNLFYVQRLLGSADFSRAFEADRLQALMRLHLVAGFDAYYVGLLFWGLASTVCSYLWLKSNYIPKVLAIWGLLSSAWAAMCAFVFFIFPGFGQAVNLYSFDTPIGLFELATSFWLVFKGLKPSGVAAPGKASI